MENDYLGETTKTLVEWNSRYLIGIPLIDEQHRELIELTNKLYEACLSGDQTANDIFKEAARRMVDYIKYHFGAEEKILENVRYPELAAHKREHEKLIKDVLEHVRLFQEGKKFIPNNFARTLKDWILNHIAMVDKKYSVYIMNLKKEGKLNRALIGE
jgi:hemerythrin